MHSLLKTFGGYALVFCAATWTTALVGEFYPYFGNRSFPYCASLAVVCHVLAALAYVFKSGRKMANIALVSFWVITGILFIYGSIVMKRLMGRLD